MMFDWGVNWGSGFLIANSLMHVSSILLIAGLVFLFTGLYKKNNGLTWAGGILVALFLILVLGLVLGSNTSGSIY